MKSFNLTNIKKEFIQKASAIYQFRIVSPTVDITVLVTVTTCTRIDANSE